MTIENSEYKPLNSPGFAKWFRVFRWRKRLRSVLSRLATLISRYVDKFGFHSFFKYLWLRIILLNMIGLILVIGGVYYLSGFRASLINLTVKSLNRHGETIAKVISASNASGSRADNGFDVDTLLWLYQDQNSPHQPDQFSNVQFVLNHHKIEPLLQRTVDLTNTRARVYEHDGTQLVDSKIFLSKGQVFRSLTPKEDKEPRKGVFYEFTRMVSGWFNPRLPLYEDIGGANGKAYSEVKIALSGQQSTVVRVSKSGQTIVSVATPIKFGSKVAGVLLLTTKGVEIDNAVGAARQEVIRVATVALIVSLILSIYLTVTIAGPMRSLSKAIKSIKASIKKRHEIPNLSHRPDEIGQLSNALRDMTSALHQRIEAIESFAADVSHELKNPLTSLRSAVETLPLVSKQEDRDHLTEVILNDVGRLNRLITDISSASRLDAELAREDRSPVNLIRLTKAIAEIFNSHHCENNKSVVVIFPASYEHSMFVVNGHDGRLGQVVNNLLDNALSFTPNDGKVFITVARVDEDVEIIVEDEGPGIPEDNLEKVFARFYTDRPGDNAFRENSGLGLNISREIVNAHKGKIWAENRFKGEKVIGARFTVRFPAAHLQKRLK